MCVKSVTWRIHYNTHRWSPPPEFVLCSSRARPGNLFLTGSQVLVIRSQDHTESSLFLYIAVRHRSFPAGSDGEESACSAGDQGSIPGLGRSLGGGHSNPLQYSCLENPIDKRSLVGYSPWGRRRVRYY